MSYYFTKVLDQEFETAVATVKNALQEVGFGVVSEINLHEKFKEKLNEDFKKYKILGACNPAFAFQAVKEEEKIGTMLPCNFIIQEKDGGKTEISAINPVESMQAIQNEKLHELAKEIERILKDVVEGL